MKTQSKQIEFNGQNFYCGIDIYQKSWTVTIQTDSLVLKTFTQDPNQRFYSNIKESLSWGQLHCRLY